MIETKPYTRAEVAKLFRKSTDTIDNWRVKGRLPFFKLGNSVFFPRKAIDEIMAGQRVGIGRAA